MSARQKVCAAALLTAPVLLVGVGMAAPIAASAAPAPVTSIAAPAANVAGPASITLQQEASIVNQAHALLPASAQPTAKLILTEAHLPAKSGGVTSVQVSFAVWSPTGGPVTVYTTIASFVPGGQTSFTPMTTQQMPYTPNLDPFAISQFKATPQEAAAAALAANPNVNVSVMDMRNSNVPHEGLGYVFGTNSSGFVSVSGITGKVTNQ